MLRKIVFWVVVLLIAGLAGLLVGGIISEIQHKLLPLSWPHFLTVYNLGLL